MSDIKISEELLKIIGSVIDLDENVHIETEIKSISGWDSLATVNILIAVEERFDIKIPIRFLAQFKKISDIKKYIELKSIKLKQ